MSTAPRFITALAAAVLGATVASSAQETPRTPRTPRGEQAGEQTTERAPQPAARQGAEQSRETETVRQTTSDDRAVKACRAFISSQTVDRKADGWKTRLAKPPQFAFDRNAEYYWDLKTNKGDIRVKLMPDVAPMHVSSTMYLTELGFYDDLKFHRVIQGFMAQGGCPKGTGREGPGYKYHGEYSEDVRHDRPGLLSMANTGSESRDGSPSDGSQFFLTFVPTPHLDGKHTIFGEVVQGMDVVKQLEAAGSRDGTPREPLKIEKATVTVEPAGAAPAREQAKAERAPERKPAREGEGTRGGG